MSVHTHLEPEIIGALSSLLTPGADIRPLPSERDLNYRVVSGTESVVLKVHAPGDQDWLELQDRALRQIRDIDVSTPHPLHPQIGRLADGRCVRLVNWVDGAYRGIGVPKATPPEVRKRLSDLWANLNNDPEMKEKAAANGFELVNIGVEQMDAFMKERIALYVEGAARLGLGKK